MSNKARSRTKVAEVIPRPDGQYCVNMAAAMVKVAMLMQFASLRLSAYNTLHWLPDAELTST